MNLIYPRKAQHIVYESSPSVNVGFENKGMNELPKSCLVIFLRLLKMGAQSPKSLQRGTCDDQGVSHVPALESLEVLLSLTGARGTFPPRYDETLIFQSDHPSWACLNQPVILYLNQTGKTHTCTLTYFNKQIQT